MKARTLYVVAFAVGLGIDFAVDFNPQPWMVVVYLTGCAIVGLVGGYTDAALIRRRAER